MDPYQILGLNKKFTLQELKDKYKTIAVKVHPDKGGTEELFLLVTKCYKLLLAEHNKRVAQKEFYDLKTDFKKSQAQPQRAHPSSKLNLDKFDLDKFNRVFSENKLEDAYDKGYKEWMSDEPVKDIVKPKGSFTIDSFNSRFEKQELDSKNKYIVKYREPEPLLASKKMSFTEIGVDQVEDFSGDNISNKNLNYMDYKVAHSTSKIVDPRLKENIQQYKNIEELEKQRSQVSYEMDEDTMREYLARKKLEKMKERQRKEAIAKQERMMNEQYERVNMLMLGRRG